MNRFEQKQQKLLLGIVKDPMPEIGFWGNLYNQPKNGILGKLSKDFLDFFVIFNVFLRFDYTRSITIVKEFSSQSTL